MKATNAHPTVDGTVRLGRNVKVSFSAKPSESIRGRLKEAGFKFFYDRWEFEASSKERAIEATKVGLELGCYLDLVGQLHEDTPDKIEGFFGTRDVKCVFDTPRFLQHERKAYILFESLDEVSEWMAANF